MEFWKKKSKKLINLKKNNNNTVINFSISISYQKKIKNPSKKKYFEYKGVVVNQKINRLEKIHIKLRKKTKVTDGFSSTYGQKNCEENVVPPAKLIHPHL